MATRCCCPPDSSLGRCERRSRESDLLEQILEELLVGLRAGDGQRQADVLLGAQHWEKVEELEDEADVLAPELGEVGVAEGCHVRPVNRDGARRRFVEGGEDVHQRRLPGARRAHYRCQLAASDVERHAAERIDARVALAVTPGDITCCDDRLSVAVEDAFVRQGFGWIHLDLGFAVADVRPRLSKPNLFGVRREDDLALILADESKVVIAADAIVGMVGYLRSMQQFVQKLTPLAQRYWFDALILIGLGVSIAVAVTNHDEPDAPNGPLWFDVAVTFAFFVPLLFRRRFPFGAPVVAAVAVTASTFVDGPARAVRLRRSSCSG